MQVDASTRLLAMWPADSLGDPEQTLRDVFFFMNFSKIFTTPSSDPGAPCGLLGFLGVRRHLANILGGSQASSRPPRDVAFVLIYCFDLGSPQGPRGSQGVTEMFSGILAVYRSARWAPRDPCGLPMVSRCLRPHRSTRGDCQSKKGSIKQVERGTKFAYSRGNQQTCETIESNLVEVKLDDLLEIFRYGLNFDLPINVDDLSDIGWEFIVLELIDILDVLVDDPDLVNNFPTISCDFLEDWISMSNAASLIKGVEHVTLSTINGSVELAAWPSGTQSLSSVVRVGLCFAFSQIYSVSPFCFVGCFVCVRATSVAHLDAYRRAYCVGVDIDLPASSGTSTLLQFMFALPHEPRRLFPVSVLLVPSPQLRGGEGRIPPCPVWFGREGGLVSEYSFLAWCMFAFHLGFAFIVLLFSLSFFISLSLSLSSRVRLSFSPCLRLSVGPYVRLCHCQSVRLCVC